MSTTSNLWSQRATEWHYFHYHEHKHCTLLWLSPTDTNTHYSTKCRLIYCWKKKRQDWILFTWHLTERYGASWLISVKITDSAWMPETGCPKSNVSLYFKKTKHQNICTVTLCSKPADIHSARCILLLTWPRWAQREIFTSSLDFQPTLTAYHVFPAIRWNMRLADISKICHKSLHVLSYFVCQDLVNSSFVPALNSLTYVLCICIRLFSILYIRRRPWPAVTDAVGMFLFMRAVCEEKSKQNWYMISSFLESHSSGLLCMCVYASMCLERACSFLWTYPNR